MRGAGSRSCRAESLNCNSTAQEIRKYYTALPFNLQTSSTVNGSPGPNAGVGNMPAASLCIAVVLKQALKLKLCHARSDSTHHLLVGKTADFIGVTDYSYLMLCLDHTAAQKGRDHNIRTTTVFSSSLTAAVLSTVIAAVQAISVTVQTRGPSHKPY